MNEKFDLIIFGGTGDLSLRKLLPAMYRAQYQGDIEDGSRILICTRKANDFDNIYSIVEAALEKYVDTEELNKARLNNFFKIIQPVKLDLINMESGWNDFYSMFESRKNVDRIFYLAVMPSIYGNCCENLSKKGLITDNSRVVVEKPIGYDFESAETINQIVAKYFSEDKVYRIDHYLGKETVQNLLALRFSNFLFENIWDSKSIDNIQISITENVGVEGRAGFYDDTGAMRDMVQNHLLQLLCLIAMENPNQLSAEEVRVEKIKVLKALKVIPEQEMIDSVVRGQYEAGDINGEKVPSYLDELGDRKSTTETFVAIRAKIENWRWSGVPFYLRTGKRLKKRRAEIIIEFKPVTHNIYAPDGQKLVPNRLIIELQPKERIQMQLMANAIGGENKVLKPIKLNLDLNTEKRVRRTDYQRLLLDAIKSNSTLFIHRDEIKAAWNWVDPIIKHWSKSSSAPESYPSGSWGPKSADFLFEHSNQYWIDSDSE